MVLDEHINRSWKCPECDEDGMTELEWQKHTRAEHPEEDPFSDFFPEYFVCGDSVDAENYRAAYLKVENETGPYYMAFDDQDSVEIVDGYELHRHDWQWVEREDTPFPRFEDE